MTDDLAWVTFQLEARQRQVRRVTVQRDTARAQVAQAQAEIARLHAVARGCTDYLGGYHGAELEIYRHGLDTVVRAMASHPTSTQTRVLAGIGQESPGAAAIVARLAFAERDRVIAELDAAGVDDGREEGDPPTGYDTPTRVELLVDARDDAREKRDVGAQLLAVATDRLRAAEMDLDEARAQVAELQHALDLLRRVIPPCYIPSGGELILPLVDALLRETCPDGGEVVDDD